MKLRGGPAVVRFVNLVTLAAVSPWLVLACATSAPPPAPSATPSRAPAPAARADDEPRAESARARVSIEVPEGWDAFERDDVLVLSRRPPAQDAVILVVPSADRAALERLRLTPVSAGGPRDRVGGREVARARGGSGAVQAAVYETEEAIIAVVPGSAQPDVAPVLAGIRWLPLPPSVRAQCFLAKGCGVHALTEVEGKVEFDPERALEEMALPVEGSEP